LLLSISILQRRSEELIRPFLFYLKLGGRADCYGRCHPDLLRRGFLCGGSGGNGGRAGDGRGHGPWRRAGGNAGEHCIAGGPLFEVDDTACINLTSLRCSVWAYGVHGPHMTQQVQSRNSQEPRSSSVSWHPTISEIYLSTLLADTWGIYMYKSTLFPLSHPSSYAPMERVIFIFPTFFFCENEQIFVKFMYALRSNSKGILLGPCILRSTQPLRLSQHNIGRLPAQALSCLSTAKHFQVLQEGHGFVCQKPRNSEYLSPILLYPKTS
jgi:hypothetical protein